MRAAQIEQAQLADRSILWTWCMRGTLHLVTVEDARWLIPLFGPVFIKGGHRRLAELGWDAGKIARGIDLLEKTLAEQEALTREEITHLLETAGLPYQGQATFHLIYRAALEGILCAGPERGKQAAYTLFEHWAGKLESLPRPEALSRLAWRYLSAYGPARPEDFANWAGLRLEEARQGWELIREKLVEVTVEGKRMWLAEEQAGWVDETPLSPGKSSGLLRLLPRYDTYILGYANRDLMVDPAFSKRINAGGGIIHPSMIVVGWCAGTWKTRKQKRRLKILIEPFGDLPEDLLRQIDREVEDISRFLEGEAAARYN
jgi:hypothetical protein